MSRISHNVHQGNNGTRCSFVVNLCILCVLCVMPSAAAIWPEKPFLSPFGQSLSKGLQPFTAFAVAGLPHVANEAARLSLTGIAEGYQVIQDSNATTYTYNGVTVEAVQVIGAGTAEANGFYTQRGMNDGKPWYQLWNLATGAAGDNGTVYWSDGAEQWRIWALDNVAYNANEAVARPDLVLVWEANAGLAPVPTTAHITSKDNILIAAFASGAGTAEANGIYTERGTVNSKKFYNLLGAPDSENTSAIYWATTAWEITNTEHSGLYNSAENVTFPWLVPAWSASGGDTPVPTVASLSYGKLIAGVTIGSVKYKRSSDSFEGGRNKYQDLAALLSDVIWTGTAWDDQNGHTGSGDTAVPFDASLGTRNDVAVLENWSPNP